MTNLRNSVKLIGRLGNDPEVRTFESGKKKATFSIATTDSYKNQKGEKVQDTQWHTHYRIQQVPQEVSPHCRVLQPKKIQQDEVAVAGVERVVVGA